MTIPGVTPFTGTLPAENEPASFPARAEALFDWLTGDAAPEINAVATAINTALNDNDTLLDTAAEAIALTTNANTLVATAGSGNAYTITPAVTVAAYEAGQVFLIRPNRANTGAVTLKVGARAAVNVQKLNSAGTAFVNLAANDWRPGEIYSVQYDGTRFVLLQVPLQNFVRNNITQTITASWSFGAGLNGVLGNTTPAAATVTSLTASGTVTAGSTIQSVSTFPQIVLDETDGTATHRKVSLFKNADRFSIRTLSSTNTSEATDYEMVMGASGAISHSFRAGGIERLKVEASTTTVIGNLSVSGSISTIGSLSASGGIATTAPSSMVTITPQNATSDLGFIFNPWRAIYLANAPVVSSDARLKHDIADLTEAERRAAARIKTRTFIMNDSGQKKVGYIAQEVIEAMASEGLCAFEYGLVSHGETYGVDMDAINAFRLV